MVKRIKEKIVIYRYHDGCEVSDSSDSDYEPPSEFQSDTDTSMDSDTSGDDDIKG